MSKQRLRLSWSAQAMVWIASALMAVSTTNLGAQTLKNSRSLPENEVEPHVIALMAQTPPISLIQTSRDTATELRKFTDPEIQLSREISTSLSELERSCQVPSTPSSSVALNSPERTSSENGAAKTSAQPDVPRLIAIDSALLEVSAQAALLEADMRRYRIAHAIDQPGLCALLPESWRLNMQCSTYQSNLQRLRLVQAESSRYYKTVEYKYKIYKLTQDLELRGCTRPGFTFRLWQADQRYLLPRLKMSASWFGQVLNAR